MSGFGKILMILGGILFVVGLLLQFTRLGRLPGDIVYQRGNFTFYFPVMSCILISIVLTLLFYIFGKLR